MVSVDRVGWGAGKWVFTENERGVILIYGRSDREQVDSGEGAGRNVDECLYNERAADEILRGCVRGSFIVGAL